MNSLQEKYVNPFTDFGFKKLFGEEPNKDLLLDFLNELIHEQGRIQKISYLKNEQLGRMEIDRRAIFDIYCESETGEKFIVELQKAKQNFFKDRSLFYATFPIQEQALKGEWNFELKAVYTIGILDFVFEEDHQSQEYYHHHIQLMETKNKKVFYHKLTFIYLEMPKFKKEEEELKTHFEKWLYVIKNLPKLEKRPVKLQEKVFEKLFEVAEIAKFNHEEWQAYEDSLKCYRDLQNVLLTKEEEGLKKGIGIGMEKGLKEGKEEGLKEGIGIGKEEGLKEGLDQGRKEREIQIAKEMLESGIPEKQIAKISGLSMEMIKKL